MAGAPTAVPETTKGLWKEQNPCTGEQHETMVNHTSLRLLLEFLTARKISFYHVEISVIWLQPNLILIIVTPTLAIHTSSFSEQSLAALLPAPFLPPSPFL